MNRTALVSASRTPHGSYLGCLSALLAPQLGGHALRSVVDQNLQLNGVFMGCVLSGGTGQGPARQAAYHAGIPWNVPATMVNKVCGSGLQAIIFAHQALCHTSGVYVAGGMESMSQAPYLLQKARSPGYKIGHQQAMDLIFRDGLEDAYPEKPHSPELMGVMAQAVADSHRLTRQDQDQYTQESYQNFQKALAEGWIAQEITPITLGGNTVIAQDEPPSRVNVDKFSQLKPAFGPQGTITAATSSSLADGAAAVCMMDEKTMTRESREPLAWIVGYTTFSQEPKLFTTSPIYAIQNLLKELNWTVDQVDIFEVNEAFAMVPMLVQRELNIPRHKMNPQGSACALGHPLGATGARLMVTLAHQLKRKGQGRGIACACIGGGEAIAIALER